MRGLIIKDFLSLKRQAKTFGAMMVLYAVLGFMMDDSNMLIGMITVIISILPVTAMAYDEQAKWERYALTLPLSRTQLVVSKYILALVLIAVGIVLGFGVSALITILKGETLDAIMLGTVTLTCAGVGLFINSALLPFLFKLGSEKARMMMMAIMILPTVLIVIVAKMGLTVNEGTLKMALILLPIFLVLLFVVSLFISIQIYKKKEF